MTPVSGSLAHWARALGYDRIDGALLSVGADTKPHPFAPELRAIPPPCEDPVGNGAVFCIDRVPTVYLLASESLPKDPADRRSVLRSFCERLWNQNLVRVLLVCEHETLEAWSVDNPDAPSERYHREENVAVATWSAAGLLSGEALAGRDRWFDAGKRVDKMLLDNILALVSRLVECGFDGSAARRLVARVIFITYLEDRDIVGEVYRAKRGVRPLFDLIGDSDRPGLRELIASLRNDFNGDFLSSADGESGWEDIGDDAFGAIRSFLARTTLRTGQLDFWRYDFSQIPIELIASVYETFLSAKDAEIDAMPADKAKRRQGAYYTPRLLAEWLVDLVVEGRDPLQERFYDGACGSGMLLTAAFRRLIRAYEADRVRVGQPAEADYEARQTLLLDRIFGGDIDEDACQLTAFSLYLALLSDLNPRDLAVLKEGGRKLPSLTSNIRRGADGNFFGDPLDGTESPRCSILLSNPPWRELAAGDPAAISLEAWRMRQPEPRPHIPKRQIAAAFALGAADAVEAGGRVALILPITPFVSGERTQREFRAHLLGRYKIERIVNFADMRRLIFADAVHPFVVLIASPRPVDERFTSIEMESFEYWTPKTDISLAFGRLTVHGGDRADLPVSALIDDDPQLAIRYWGDEADVTLLRRLRTRGTLGALEREHGWLFAKGFHTSDEDQRRPPDSWYRPVPDWLRAIPFLHAKRLPSDLPVVPPQALEHLLHDRIARVPEQRLFSGPRVLWPDGAHPTAGVKALYAETPFSFQHSLAVMSAPPSGEGRLVARFVTAYLRSPLGLWLLLLLSSSVASERPKLHLAEAAGWPFWLPDQHPNPDEARGIMAEADRLLGLVENERELLRAGTAAAVKPALDHLVFQYFRLSEDEIARVKELAQFAGPAIQPTSLRHRALMRPLRQPPTDTQIIVYGERLARSLRRWRDATRGEGEITASIWRGRTVPVAAAVLSLGTESGADRLNDDDAIEELAGTLGRVTGMRGETLLTIPDIAMLDGQRLFVVKPLISRFWLERNAVGDAGKLALQLQGLAQARLPA
jgi:hypothetical protein